MFFEGSEKKVEIAFADRNGSLRSLDDHHWHTVVAKAKATILSKISSARCDAYLLSESSLFVYDYSLIMITCGTTSLIDAVFEILSFTNPADIRLLVYERKNEFLPEHQPSDFHKDVARLQGLFPGETHLFGREDGNHIKVFYHHAEGFQPPGRDMTLEILMNGLSPHAQALFSDPKQSHQSLFARAGLDYFDSMFKNRLIDDFLFDPMGYSLNCIGNGEYYTIHVTPQQHCSYASFETNHFFGADLNATVAAVVGIFQPQNFSVLFFQRQSLDYSAPKGYRICRKETGPLGGYKVCFGDFEAV